MKPSSLTALRKSTPTCSRGKLKACAIKNEIWQQKAGIVHILCWISSKARGYHTNRRMSAPGSSECYSDVSVGSLTQTEGAEAEQHIRHTCWPPQRCPVTPGQVTASSCPNAKQLTTLTVHGHSWQNWRALKTRKAVGSMLPVSCSFFLKECP